MKKNTIKKLLPIALVAMTLASCKAEDKGGKTETYDLTIKVWAAEAAKELTETQCKTWAADVLAKGGKKIGISVEPVSESTAAGNMVTDVEAGADVYFFAQDQLSRLVNAGALSTIVDENLKNELLTNNDEASVSAIQAGGNVVAFPVTSDNGFVMYYDKSVFPDESKLLNMTDIISVSEEAGKKVYFKVVGSAWYNSAYFQAFGCHSHWETDENGVFTSYDDNYNSAGGKKAMKALYELVGNKAVYINDEACSTAFSKDKDGKRSASVCVSGTWDYKAAKIALGDDLGAIELPSVTVNGETQHLGGFNGCKLLGVKPQSDATKGAYCQALAKYLTSEAGQLERFNALGWGPTNLNAQKDEGVKANPVLAALKAQAEYSEPQGQLPGGWWSTAAGIVETLANVPADANLDTEIAKILKTYDATIDTYLG